MKKLGLGCWLVSALALAGCTTVVKGGGETGGGIQDPETSDIELPDGAGGADAVSSASNAQASGAQVGSGAGGPGGPLGESARLVTIGSVGLEYEHLGGPASFTGNLPFLMNALAWLAEGRGVMGDYRFLHLSDCDPRTSASVCQKTDDAAALQPYYDALAELGQVTYATTDEASLDDYAAVIVNFCDLFGVEEAVHDAVFDHLRGGGRILVAAQYFCLGTPERASALLEPFGVAWTELDPTPPLNLTIPPEEQTGFLEGVEKFDVYRWTPQTLEPTSAFVPIVESQDGILAAYAVLDPRSIPAP